METDRTTASVVGEVVRTLLLARIFWGRRAEVRVCDLPEIVAISERRLRRVLYVLYRQRWIWYDCDRGLVGLTERGFADLTLQGRSSGSTQV